MLSPLCVACLFAKCVFQNAPQLHIRFPRKDIRGSILSSLPYFKMGKNGNVGQESDRSDLHFRTGSEQQNVQR